MRSFLYHSGTASTPCVYSNKKVEKKKKRGKGERGKRGKAEKGKSPSPRPFATPSQIRAARWSSRQSSAPERCFRGLRGRTWQSRRCSQTRRSGRGAVSRGESLWATFGRSRGSLCPCRSLFAMSIALQWTAEHLGGGWSHTCADPVTVDAMNEDDAVETIC